MEYLSWENWVGYVASAFVLASFLIHNNINLTRFINLIGCAVFVVYGYLIDSLPVIIPNLVLVGVQVYFLFFKKKV